MDYIWATPSRELLISITEMCPEKRAVCCLWKTKGNWSSLLRQAYKPLVTPARYREKGSALERNSEKVAQGRQERWEDIEREKENLDRPAVLKLFEANVWDLDRQAGWISSAVRWPKVTAQKQKSFQTHKAYLIEIYLIYCRCLQNWTDNQSVCWWCSAHVMLQPCDSPGHENHYRK